MKFALVNGVKVEATKGTKGVCPSCGSELFAKCGEVKVNHWAHKGNRDCDPWWENETEWHRAWKGQFPVDWQEVIHKDKDGEKHIADVKTNEGWILEFQYSYLKPEERRARNAFYRKLVWIVNGTRRPTDTQQFEKAIQESIVLWEKPLVLWVLFPDKCRLLKEWDNSSSLIFYDFHKADLWYLYPKISLNETYLSFFPRNSFSIFHNKNKFDEIVKNIFYQNCKDLKEKRQTLLERSLKKYPNQLHLIERYLANK